jgi:sugar-specific transcriptional regulator TrmB
MTPEKSLQEMGLSDQEAAIYMALLKTGGLAASLVAKETGLRRTTAYAILKGMTRKGFVTVFVRKGRQVFVAEKPQSVAGYFEKRLKNFSEGIPMLELLEKKQLKSGGLRFIESVDELKRFYAGILREYRGRSYDALGNSNAWQGLEPEFFIQYRKDRANAGIRTRVLITADSGPASPTDPALLREVKFLPKNYAFKSTMDIFDDKVLIISPEQTSLAIVIAVPAMVDIFKSTFQMLWDLMPEGKKVPGTVPGTKLL